MGILNKIPNQLKSPINEGLILIFWATVFGLIAWFSDNYAYAHTRVTQLDVTITLNENGRALIKEEIDVYKAGRISEDSHLIRSIPTAHSGVTDERQDSHLRIIEVSLNNRPENYYLSYNADGSMAQLQLNSFATIIRGKHRYTLVYELDNRLFGDGTETDQAIDHFFWRPIWKLNFGLRNMPAENISLTLKLPPNADPNRVQYSMFADFDRNELPPENIHFNGIDTIYYRFPQSIDKLDQSIMVMAYWWVGKTKRLQKRPPLESRSTYDRQLKVTQKHILGSKKQKGWIEEKLILTSANPLGPDLLAYHSIPRRIKDLAGFNVLVEPKIEQVLMNGKNVDYELDTTADWQWIFFKYDFDHLPQGTPVEYTLKYQVNNPASPMVGHDYTWETKTEQFYILPQEIQQVYVLSQDFDIDSLGITTSAGYDFERTVENRQVTLTAKPRSVDLESYFKVGARQKQNRITSRAWINFFRANLGFSWALALLIFMVGFMWWAWIKVGRDPKPYTIITRYSPPPNVSPAMTRFLWKGKIDYRAMVATLTNLVYKGHLKIQVLGDSYALQRQKGHKQLSQEETAMLDSLFDRRQRLVLKWSNALVLTRALNILEVGIKKNSTVYYRSNLPYILAVAVFSVIALLLTAMDYHDKEPVTSLFLFSVAVTVIGTGLSGIILIYKYVTQPLKRLLNVTLPIHKLLWGAILFLISLLIILLFTSITADLAISLATEGFIGTLMIGFLATVIVGIFYLLIPRYTKEGHALLDHLKGFRHYLITAEKDRMAYLHPKKTDLEKLYLKYLPYAIALDVETVWSSHFAGVIKYFHQLSTMDVSQIGQKWYKYLAQVFLNEDRRKQPKD